MVLQAVLVEIILKKKKKKPLLQLFPLSRFDGRTNKLRFTRKTNKLYLSLGQLGRNGEMKDRSVEGRRRQAGEKEMKPTNKLQSEVSERSSLPPDLAASSHL